MKRLITVGILFAVIFPPAAHALDTAVLRISGNLDATSSVSAPPSQPTTYAALNSLSAFGAFANIRDSLNVSHTLNIFFFHTGVNSWTMQIYVDGGETTGGTAGAPVLAAVVTMGFSAGGDRINVPANDGALTATWNNGSSAAATTVSAAQFTQYGSSSSIGSISDDSNGNCGEIAQCVQETLPTTLADCTGASLSCSFPVSDFVLLPSDITQLALTRQDCLRTFSSARSCRKCYDKALVRLRYAEKSRLFGNFLREAKAQLTARKANACR